MTRNLAAIIAVFLSVCAVASCSDSEQGSCVGSQVCGNSCPETITMKTAALEADGDSYSFPDGLNEAASANFGCLLDSAMGSYETTGGARITLSPDPDGFALYPEEDVLSGCANWIFPVVIASEGEQTRGGIVSEAAYACTGEEYVIEGVYGAERLVTIDESNLFCGLKRDAADVPWHLETQGDDGNPIVWIKQ